ncbi:class I SAM-dependent methyltransferase [Nocardia sp. CDC159]|uniref:Class I SAM-dependent methyltransferase n=1 Tax=Nocardia pulmonis TaxID=2951408 RepID=A0A9X2EAX8_9NOCA|nr:MULTISPECIES: class I SAM-dependent methyltransferase [Nocardia]MCM6777552.1 class I SAM-dependent methyltransferase [Nocardia pulmonis]MCM6790341.1 class I SAM-dependent methyltransferase [Nocardia sp. CDC159]
MRDSMASEWADVAATRAGYDALAEKYAEIAAGEMDKRPFDRAMLRAFADVVRGTVAELGCGPGRIAAHLHGLGLDVFGIDLSPEMIRLARAAYPRLRFDQGTMEDLALADGALGGIVAWYSIIHTPPERIPAVFTEFGRVLADGGHLLLAFQAVDDATDVLAHDHAVAQAYWWSLRGLESRLRDAGFRPIARLWREGDPDERGPQGYLLATKRPES